MRWVTLGVSALCLCPPAGAAGPPAAEAYLHTGDLARGERALERALDAAPKDDQLRFGLGVVRVARAVERLGQALYEHGVKADSTSLPFLRVPVPRNPDPTPITYPVLRRVFEQLTDDLARTEATLAGVTDDGVRLPLRLAGVRLDLDGDGRPTDALVDVLKRVAGGTRLAALDGNPEFLVAFDRGDVAWLRAYCHLLSAAADLYLAVDGRPLFDTFAADYFARPKGLPDRRPGLLALLDDGLGLPEPGRLHSLRRHLLAVCALNRETWAHVRAETDDDHEWLPNPRQAGVLGLPVTDAMIDGWLAAVGELEAVLRGDKLVDLRGLPGADGRTGFDLRAFLDDPPRWLDFGKVVAEGVDPKYVRRMTAANRADDRAFERLPGLFGDGLAVAYAAWFN